MSNHESTTFYDEFINSLLPGNYALTKSMELTKVQNSGTLWYTKKFLTLYYYIFLSNDIMTKTYQHEVIGIFDDFIKSLPVEVQENAEKYFYPENEAINFKSDHFNLFSNFASYNIFENQDERNSYYQSAKKYYFSLLMGSGGQTGIKKMLKEAVQKPGFVYSHENIDNIILCAAIDVCMREANANQEISDNSVKYILSNEAIEKAVEMASLKSIDEADIRQLNKDYPHNRPNYRGIENDMVAFIRNERQILYYYGYFHSKSTGATDFEFSSLTPIGELALKANANEFLIIWEHQKIKMISQPATADINQIPTVVDSPQNFGISYTPYIDILGHVFRQGSMSLQEYKYIVSRKKHCFDKGLYESEEKNIVCHLDQIIEHVNMFGRQRDKADEDGRKELFKYLLGVRSDLSMDAGLNPLGVLKYENLHVSTDCRDTLAVIYNVYSKLNDYKIQKYEKVFKSAEDDLRKRYSYTVAGNSTAIDSKVKINWDLYNIHPDNMILLSVAITFAAISLNIGNVEDMSRKDINDVSEFLTDNFTNLLKAMGIRTLTKAKKEVQNAVLSIRNNDYSSYLNMNDNNNEQIIAKYKAQNASDLFAKIEQISATATVVSAENRERNATLVSMLKSYYLQCFAENNMLKCECCGKDTFITSDGEPYVEFHHLIPFNIAYGPDHYLNLFALCPNCHRKIHFSHVDDKRGQYEDLSNNNYMHLCFTERLKRLRLQNLLKSYHLEFLLADNAITIDEYNDIAA